MSDAVTYAMLSENTTFVEVVKDLNDQLIAAKNEIAMLKHEATHDSLTDLLNRRGMYEATAKHSFRYAYSIDADGLKEVNDTQGHAAGDILLKEVADLCKYMAYIGDGVAVRLGGDEFVVLSMNLVQIDTHESVAFSRGFAPIINNDLDKALSIADVRMYKNKKIRKAAR